MTSVPMNKSGRFSPNWRTASSRLTTKAAATPDANQDRRRRLRKSRFSKRYATQHGRLLALGAPAHQPPPRMDDDAPKYLSSTTNGPQKGLWAARGGTYTCSIRGPCHSLSSLADGASGKLALMPALVAINDLHWGMIS